MSAVAVALPAAVRVGAWRIWRLAAGVPDAVAWIARVEELARTTDALHRSKHAATYRWARSQGDVYVKVYHRYRRTTALKDALRPSKARHVARVSAGLATAGFRVPRVLAAGEERHGVALGRAWVATAAVAGEPVADRLAVLARGGDWHARLTGKRVLLAAIGAEVARLHAVGAVAGDLVPANVWVTGADVPAITLLDHDRTRLGRAPAPWRRARRNLVQLNRVVLAGVTATDRLRVFRAYAAGRGWAWRPARRRLRWIVAKTIARRRRFDRVVLARGRAVSFRELMRADGPFAPGADDAGRGGP